MRLFDISISGRGQVSKETWQFLDWYCRRYRNVITNVLGDVLMRKILYGETVPSDELGKMLRERMKDNDENLEGTHSPIR